MKQSDPVAWMAARGTAPALPFRRWRGEPVSGKQVLIWSEHGYGDQIMYARFAKQLVEQGALVRWACPRPLARLFATIGVDALADDTSFDLSGVDFYCPSSSLPLGFPELPAPPFLTVQAADASGRIGIVSSGSATNPARSLPDPDAERLLSMPGAIDLRPEATGAGDFYETATLMAGLEHVVSVDTAGAHLAGALGTPLTVLLPYDADWRWGSGPQTPWYPSATLLRQPAPGAWEPAIAHVELLARKAMTRPDAPIP